MKNENKQWTKKSSKHAAPPDVNEYMAPSIFCSSRSCYQNVTFVIPMVLHNNCSSGAAFSKVRYTTLVEKERRRKDLKGMLLNENLVKLFQFFQISRFLETLLSLITFRNNTEGLKILFKKTHFLMQECQNFISLMR